MKIFIDPGHNYSGADTGAVGNNLREQDISFYISKKLERLFINNKDEVKLSRQKLTDSIGSTVSESIAERCAAANEWDADLFISIHTNSGGGTGSEVLVYSLEGKAAEIAARVEKELTTNLVLADRGVKARPDLGVLRGTKCPAILVETAFIDTPHDAKLLRENQQDFADAIFTGVTGKAVPSEIHELTKPNDIVWEFSYRGIVEDTDGMLREMEDEPNGRLYWLARKALQYIRERGV